MSSFNLLVYRGKQLVDSYALESAVVVGRRDLLQEELCVALKHKNPAGQACGILESRKPCAAEGSGFLATTIVIRGNLEQRLLQIACSWRRLVPSNGDNDASIGQSSPRRVRVPQTQ